MQRGTRLTRKQQTGCWSYHGKAWFRSFLLPGFQRKECSSTSYQWSFQSFTKAFLGGTWIYRRPGWSLLSSLFEFHSDRWIEMSSTRIAGRPACGEVIDYRYESVCVWTTRCHLPGDYVVGHYKNYLNLHQNHIADVQCGSHVILCDNKDGRLHSSGNLDNVPERHHRSNDDKQAHQLEADLSSSPEYGFTPRPWQYPDGQAEDVHEQIIQYNVRYQLLDSTSFNWRGRLSKSCMV